MSRLSWAKPPVGTRRACIASVKTAGSRELAPYTALVDLSTRRRTAVERWQAASSCMVPMTFSSFIDARPPAPAGVRLMFMWTTVSTAADSITFPINGLRMSARTNSVRPRRRSTPGAGGTVSTPMTRSIARSAASSAANAPPSHRLTPVTRTTAGGTSVSSLLVASLDAGLLEELAVLLLRHPLAALLDDRTHVLLPTSWSHGCDRERPGSVTPGTVRGDQLVRGPLPPGTKAARRMSLPGRRHDGTAPLQGPAASQVTFWSGRLAGSHPERAKGGGRGGPCSGDVGVGVAQVLVHGALGDPEGAAHADGGQLATVDEAVDGHLRDAHEGGDLGDGQERDGGTRGRDGGRAADRHGGRVGSGDGAGQGCGRHGPTHRPRRRNARASGLLERGAVGHGHVVHLRFSTSRATGFPTGGRDTHVLERTIWGPE